MNILAHPEVARALDCDNRPDWAATFAIGTVAKALNHDVNEMTLSRSSMRRSRYKNHEMVTVNMKDEFLDNSTVTLLLLHCDEKLLVDITGS